DLPVKPGHQRVHVFATPVVAGQISAHRSITAVALVVGKGDQPAGAVPLLVRIEVVVNVHAVDVVPADYVDDDLHRSVLHLGLSGIHPQVRAIPLDEVRAGAAQVVG